MKQTHFSTPEYTTPCIKTRCARKKSNTGRIRMIRVIVYRLGWECLEKTVGCLDISARKRDVLSTPVCVGRHPHLAPKDAAEITAVGEANRQRDLGDALVGLLEQRFCQVDAVAIEIRNRGDA